MPTSFVAEGRLPENYPPFQTFREQLGFLPSIFRAQSLLPRAIEAEAAIAGAFLLGPGVLSRVIKEEILVAVAAAHANVYCVAAHAHILRSLGSGADDIDSLIAGRYDGRTEPQAALLDFSVRLGLHPTSIGPPDFDRLRGLGFTDEQLLEAVQTAALTRFLCTLSAGLGVERDFELPTALGAVRPPAVGASPGHRTPGPHLSSVEKSPETFPPFAFLRKSFGFIPNIFRAQTLKPSTLEAEAQAIRDILLTEDVLTRKQKECILLVISAANLNTYCVAVHCEMLRALGVSADASDQIAVDHRRSDLSEADKTLLDVTLKLATRPGEYGRTDVESLRGEGFREEQILEAIVMAALTSFLNTLQMGLGTVPDFRPRRDFLAEAMNLSSAPAHPIGDERAARGPIEDPDAEAVARASAGDMTAFEGLVRGHQGRVYRTLMGITGNAEDAQDGTQAVFIKVFRKIKSFSGQARFATWLTRIAINEGLERLRSRRNEESLDERPEEDFRPSNLQPWVDDPESRLAREEMRGIVEEALGRLPALYRAAVVLRDLDQLSGAEAAAALNIPLPTLKTRLLRGRLMLREALSVHLTEPRRQALV
jgi:RNA polymerase sigma-70 factor (ECF subfamily)